jgi:hypothetical protein
VARPVRYASVAGRLLLVAASILVVEIIRASLHWHKYSTGKTWAWVLGAAGLNFFWHKWALEDTYLKVGLSALYKQTTLPYAAAYIWALIANIVREPPG